MDPGVLRQAGQPATLAIVAWALVLAGCGSDSRPTSASDASAAAGVEEDIQLACTDLLFPASRLLVLGAEIEPGPAADALRAVLTTNAGFIEGVPFPKSGWTLAVETADEVQFVAFETRQMEDRPWYLIAFQLRNGRWNGHYTGECRLHAAALEPGFAAGEWWLSKPAEPTDRTLSAVVRDPGCVTGPARAAKVGRPIVVLRGTEVKVVVPVPKTDDGSCSMGPTPTTIDLGQPLGNRRLLDASYFPTREVPVHAP